MTSQSLKYEPTSKYFVVKATENSAGRGVFASQWISKNTNLLTTNLIAICVINKEYRKEVCAQCFRYDRGRNHQIRDTNVNLAYCSSACQRIWAENTESIIYDTLETVESFLRKKSSKAVPIPDFQGEQERPTAKAVVDAWDSVETTANFVRQARYGSSKKPHKRALEASKNVGIVADNLHWQLSGIITHHLCLDSPSNQLWPAFQNLASDLRPYQTRFNLDQSIYGYLQLLAILPREVLPSVTSEICQQVVAKDVNNAFGIRSLEDEGSEFFGWGVWPEASYFNHSCSPNLAKCRDARSWTFWAARDIVPNEQLYISYLGGDEKNLNINERRERLNKTWGFICMCEKCLNEADMLLAKPNNSSPSL